MMVQMRQWLKVNDAFLVSLLRRLTMASVGATSSVVETMENVTTTAEAHPRLPSYKVVKIVTAGSKKRPKYEVRAWWDVPCKHLICRKHKYCHFFCVRSKFKNGYSKAQDRRYVTVVFAGSREACIQRIENFFEWEGDRQDPSSTKDSAR